MGKDSKKKKEAKHEEHKHKHKHEEAKEHKHSHHDKKEKKHTKDRDEITKENSEKKLPPQITEEDFFEKSIEFRVWLKLYKEMFFENLSTKETRDLFEGEFMKHYNKGKLSSMFYDGNKYLFVYTHTIAIFETYLLPLSTGNIPLSIREATVKSKHRQWLFQIIPFQCF